MTNEVTNPSHYTSQKIECKEIVKYLNFYLGSAFKYIWRHKHKGGLQDLHKAVQYIEFQRDEDVEFRYVSGNVYHDSEHAIRQSDFSDLEKEALIGILWNAINRPMDKRKERKERLSRLISAIESVIQEQYPEDIKGLESGD